jgi:hypothetical protein
VIARRRARNRREAAGVTLACFGLVTGFLFAPAANAAEPRGLFAASPSLPVQHFVVEGGTAETAASRDNLTASDVPAVGAVTVTPGNSTNADWAALILVDGGWPTSSNNITAILQWMDSENSPQDWWLRNNPLNNGYGSGGGSGFGSYSDLRSAAQNVADGLKSNSGYDPIIAAFSSSAPVGTTVSAIEGSPWASSHYGYGSLWHGVDVPIVAAPQSAWG